MIALLRPDWPAPPQIVAASTLRSGGHSSAPWASANFGTHVGDAPTAVAANRAALRQQLGLACEPLWLNQVHGTRVVDAARPLMDANADGSFSRTSGRACVVMTADCLPLLLTNRHGDWVAALHAGWRGLANGIIDAGLAHYPGPRSELLVWLGPCIGPGAFEVGHEVRTAFVAAFGDDANTCFVAHGDRLLADLPALARLRLQQLGVEAIYGGQWCTYDDEQQFFSYRRQPISGRMASLIAINAR